MSDKVYVIKIEFSDYCEDIDIIFQNEEDARGYVEQKNSENRWIKYYYEEYEVVK